MPINAVNLTGTIFPAGPKGETGPANNLEIGTVEKGIEASATITGDAPNQILNLVLPKGDKGEKGDTGSTNSLEIGTVERGTEASATITGDAPNQTLNLVLPKGDTGEKGDTGPRGEQGIQGEPGPINSLKIGKIESGTEASATITGESPNQVLNLVLPIGPKGDTGEKGDTGPKGEQGIQGETGPTNSLIVGLVSSGEKASATIVGEAPDQILNLVLPKGDKGEKGDIGPKGEQGLQGEIGPANSLTIGTVEKGTEPSATITGDAPNQVLNLVLPTGETAEIEALKAKHAQEISALENLIPTGQASGESIDLNDSAEYKFKKFGISGNSKQETRSGKNKLPYNYYNGNSKTVNGITFTVNKDRSITANGTATANATFDMVDINSYAITAGSYKLVGENSEYTKTAIRGSYKKADGTTKYVSSVSDFTIEEGSTNVYFYVVILQGETVNNVTFYPMLLKSTETDLTFEAGGASPSPDYPSEIKNIEGNIEFKVEGKNKFDKSKDFTYSNISKNLWTITQIENGLRVMSNFSAGSPYIRYVIMDLSNFIGKTIRAKANFVNSSTNKGQYRFSICNIDGTNTTPKVFSKESNKEISFIIETLEEGRKYLALDLFSNSDGTQSPTAYVDYTDIMITIDDEDMTYEPYKSQVATFPLGEEKLMEGSYLADDGIHHKRKQSVVNSDIMNTVPNGNKVLIYYPPNKTNKFNNILISSNAIFDKQPQFKSGTVYENISNVVFVGTQEDTLETLQVKYNGSILEYELAEEEIEPYTEEQQEVYDKIKELYSYKGTTHITCEDEVSCIFQAEYYKDLETILNNMQAQILAE